MSFKTVFHHITRFLPYIDVPFVFEKCSNYDIRYTHSRNNTILHRVDNCQFIIHYVALTLVLSLIDLHKSREKTSSQQTFNFIDRDTTEIYTNMVNELDDISATQREKLPSRTSYRKQLASTPPSYATAHF